MATMISNEQATAAAIERRRIVDAEIAELSKGIDLSKVNLKVYRGNRYFAVVFNADGSPAYKTDPDDGTQLMRKLTGDSGWQFADALYGEWKSAGVGSKMMAWQWDNVNREYVPSRTKYRDNVALQPAGILEQVVERKIQKSTKTSLPGLAELSFLSDKVAEISKAVKSDKEHVKKGIAVFNKAHKIDLVKYSVMACKGIGMEKVEALTLLREFWPELFAKEEKNQK